MGSIYFVISLLSQIYCEGPILEAVQRANLFNDSKHFVDMTLKTDPVTTLKNFGLLGDKVRHRAVLQQFVDDHFDPPGTELIECFPDDWNPFPETFRGIHDYHYRRWALHLHRLWRVLCRRVKEDVRVHQDRYSLLYVPYPFIIPGGRFREFYYWDSYWILKGLLVSEMYATARGVIANLAYMIDNHGFVPNGGRVYYLTRSQPPLLCLMVYDYYIATGDIDFLLEVLPSLEQEYKFWLSHRATSYLPKTRAAFQQKQQQEADARRAAAAAAKRFAKVVVAEAAADLLVGQSDASERPPLPTAFTDPVEELNLLLQSDASERPPVAKAVDPDNLQATLLGDLPDYPINYFQYRAHMKMPRPESYREDLELVENLTSHIDRERMWSDVASAAETGWDFSTRWFAQDGPENVKKFALQRIHLGSVPTPVLFGLFMAHSMSSIKTTSIIPVDLNAFLCMNARILASLFEVTGNLSKVLLYQARYEQAKLAMAQMHWNESDGIWYDYDLSKGEHNNVYYISNTLPLFAKCYDDEHTPHKVYEYLTKAGVLKFKKGLPTSLAMSSIQQWDKENAWPPMIHMVILGFRMSGDADLQRVAEEMTMAWLKVTHRAFVHTHAMYEKYNVTEGADVYAGGGGEYEVQTGFGWTNGVILDLLEKYGETLTSAAARPPRLHTGLLARLTAVALLGVFYPLVSHF